MKINLSLQEKDLVVENNNKKVKENDYRNKK